MAVTIILNTAKLMLKYATLQLWKLIQFTSTKKPQCIRLRLLYLKVCFKKEDRHVHPRLSYLQARKLLLVALEVHFHLKHLAVHFLFSNLVLN